METLETYRNKLRKTNDAFNKASDAEKRVMIAQDVLALLKVDKNGQIVIQSGGYCTLQDDYENHLDTNDLSVDHLDDIIVAGAGCSVCAKGALFLAHVFRFDNFRVTDSYIDDTEFNDLITYFDKFQWDLIEMAFEGNIIKDEYEEDEEDEEDDEEVKAALNFHIRYNTDTEILAGIMNNIIKNNGTFIP